MTALVEAALAYAARGWAVVPVRSNKHFYTTDGVGIATRDPRIIRGWYWAEAVGMACGAPSGTDVLDVDNPEAFPLDLAALIASTQAASTTLRRGSPILQARWFANAAVRLGRVAIDGTRSGAAAWIGTGVDQWQGSRTCASGAS